MCSKFYDREGNPISLYQWALMFENDEAKRVARTELGDVVVSTVWLGLDHGWGDDDRPLIFETMVFEGKMDGEQMRYSTEEEARTGHQAMVIRVRNKEGIQ
jgi:hypothetical protein